MSQFFHETAHNKTDLAKYGEGIERIFGKKKDDYCECGFKPAFCECNLDDEKENEDAVPRTV